jgi:hypothetical protein
MGQPTGYFGRAVFKTNGCIGRGIRGIEKSATFSIKGATVHKKGAYET